MVTLVTYPISYFKLFIAFLIWRVSILKVIICSLNLFILDSPSSFDDWRDWIAVLRLPLIDALFASEFALEDDVALSAF